MKTMIIDCNYLSYQAFYTMRDLDHDGVPSGVVFGFLNRLLYLGHQFRSNRFALCWDSRKSYRRMEYSEYKSHRREHTDDELATYSILWEQMDELKYHILQEIGFNNIFEQWGIEADDLMAWIAERVPDSVIVTSDEDLFQCLTEETEIFNPSSKKSWTKRSFEIEYGIHPKDWWRVKAIGGCSSDNVKGVAGVGEKKAIQWITRKMNPDTKTFEKIEAAIEAGLIDRNESLVRLPHPATKDLDICEDDFDIEGLKFVAQRYGMNSFIEGPQFKRWEDLFAGDFQVVEDRSASARHERKQTTNKIRDRRRKR